jgi:hypothetical protein
MTTCIVGKPRTRRGSVFRSRTPYVSRKGGGKRLPFYFAIFRARSNAWLRKGHVFTIDQVPGGEHPCAVPLWTAYEDAGFCGPDPRELIIEVKGEASSLDDAISAYQQVAQGFANFTAL